MKVKFLQAMSIIVLAFFAIFLLSFVLANKGIKIFDLGFPGVVENYIVIIFCVVSLVKAFIEIYEA
ncbi:hypothetical protein D6774_02885 [Candidatus Woesearchaeota archaeon]|nr:MAG: hypothetical protein D6774_02885 [Candidatus Woesearchaeota archaeon]